MDHEIVRFQCLQLAEKLCRHTNDTATDDVLRIAERFAKFVVDNKIDYPNHTQES